MSLYFDFQTTLESVYFKKSHKCTSLHAFKTQITKRIMQLLATDQFSREMFLNVQGPVKFYNAL